MVTTYSYRFFYLRWCTFVKSLMAFVAFIYHKVTRSTHKGTQSLKTFRIPVTSLLYQYIKKTRHV